MQSIYKIMDALLVIFILVLLLCGLLTLLGMLLMGKKGKGSIDYYALFIMGLLWLIIGVPIQNWSLSILGLISLSAGLINRLFSL